MSKYLSKEDYLTIAESLSPGQVERINHESDDCSGDSKSLKIEVKEDGNIVARCYRCGRRGFHGNNGVAALKRKVDATSGVPLGDKGGNDNVFAWAVSRLEQRLGSVGGRAKEGRRIIEDLGEFGIHGRLWLRTYGITESEVKTYGICYDEEWDKVLIPIFDSEGVAGYQARAVRPDDTDPKYLTFYWRPTSMLYAAPGANMERLVITEDVISAIKVGRQWLAMPLNSTQLSTKHKSVVLSRDVHDFVVFLDDDNLIVKQQQSALKRELDKFGKCAIVAQGKDPKHFTDQELKEIISCV